MFVGHLAAALAAKPLAPRASLGTLILAASFLDFLWPVLLLAGLERVRIAPVPGNPFLTLDFESYPLSHSALLAALWAVLFGLAYRARTGSARGAVVTGGLVLSHWLLDAASHLPDLPLWPGGPRVGLGLWAHVPAGIAVEGLLFAAGVAVYLAATRPRGPAGRWGFAGWVALLAGVWGASLVGPPPPGVGAIAGAGLAGGALTVAWAAWADRGRAPRAPAGGSAAAEGAT